MNMEEIRDSIFKKNETTDTVPEKSDKILNFVSVDFETMTAERTSACSIGLVRVQNGIISQEFYSLIKPIPDNRQMNNSFINGITEDMVKDAPTFKDIFHHICNFIDGLPIVCHNASMDINVFSRCMEYYKLTGISFDNYIDTYKIYNKKLTECCKDESISFSDHHNALSDAEACAKLYLCYIKCPVCFQEHTDEAVKQHYSNLKYKEYQSKKINNRKLSSPIGDSEIKNKDTLFYKKNVVITGEFEKYPNRENLAEIIWSYGSVIKSSVSRNTNIVVVGDKAGSTKIDCMNDLISSGFDIQVIEKEELYSILDKSN